MVGAGLENGLPFTCEEVEKGLLVLEVEENGFALLLLVDADEPPNSWLPRSMRCWD